MTMHLDRHLTRHPTRHLTQHVRRSTALAAAALLLSAPLLSACGFNAATDRINTISAGVNDRDGNIDVLGAVIVAPSDDTGTFVASLANNLTGDGDSATLDSFAGSGTNADVTVSGSLHQITVPPTASVSMIGRGLGIPIKGKFSVGQFVTVTLGFSNGQSSTLNVPVVRPCLQYAGITSTPGGTGAASPTEPPITMVPSESESPESQGSPGAPGSSGSIGPDGGNDDPYSCAYAVRPTEVPSLSNPGDTASP